MAAASGVGLGLSIPEVAGRARGAANDSATDALIARMSVAPGEARAALIDALVRALKAAGVWAKLDALYLLAAHDAQAARLNWVGSSFTLAAVNSPGFTVDRGYAGDGATSYLDSGFTDGSSGGFRRDDGHRGLWCGTNVNGFSFDIGSQRARIVSRYNATAYVWGNSTAGDTPALPAATSMGWTCYSRGSSAAYLFARDGTQSTVTRASDALATGSAWICAASASGYSSRRIQAAHWGRALSGGEMSALQAALAGWMTAVGA